MLSVFRATLTSISLAFRVDAAFAIISMREAVSSVISLSANLPAHYRLFAIIHDVPPCYHFDDRRPPFSPGAIIAAAPPPFRRLLIFFSVLMRVIAERCRFFDIDITELSQNRSRPCHADADSRHFAAELALFPAARRPSLRRRLSPYTLIAVRRATRRRAPKSHVRLRARERLRACGAQCAADADAPRYRVVTLRPSVAFQAATRY